MVAWKVLRRVFAGATDMKTSANPWFQEIRPIRAGTEQKQGTPSYFLAQNCGRRGCGWNRNVCGKLQGRTDLQLTPMAAYESFL
jgi:hypothetical protein